MSPYLAIDNVTVRYGKTDVLKGISLDIGAGSFVALLGSSGCGKTTLLRSVSGFIIPNVGHIRLAGVDITNVAPEKRNTAMVFQSYALWPHMSVFQNIAYGLRLRRQARAEIEEKVRSLLALLHLEGLKDRNVTQLSGGQRQRVALGRALAVDPSVLLLDEPLSNLDARIRVELRSEIRAVQTRLGITAIHVTHDREEAMVLADNIVVLNEGRIEQQGTPEDVYHRPVSPFVASFMGADNIIRLAVRPDAGGQIEARLPGESGGAVAKLPLGERGVHLAGISTDGRADAYFRAEAARLLPQGQMSPDSTLTLPASIEQVSYPGGVWRYAVRHRADRFIIDDPRKYRSGENVGIVLPADALHLFPAGS